MNIKIKHVFLLIFIAACLSFFSFEKVSADTCSSQNAGFACLDKNKVDGASECKTGLCSGGSSVQCCSLSNIKCKTDGSSFMQPCSASGLCNQAGECIDVPKSSSTTVGSATTSGGTNFTNPLKYRTVEEFLGAILGAIQKIIVMLALVFIVVGAVMILVSAGNSGMVEQGKKAITMALVGFALGVAAPSILKELAGIIGWGQAGAVASALTLSEIAVKILNFLLGSMGILALIMMVIGAIMYLTSAGDEGMAGKGKDIFKYALIGVLMAMISMVLVTQIAAFFR